MWLAEDHVTLQNSGIWYNYKLHRSAPSPPHPTPHPHSLTHSLSRGCVTPMTSQCPDNVIPTNRNCSIHDHLHLHRRAKTSTTWFRSLNRKNIQLKRDYYWTTSFWFFNTFVLDVCNVENTVYIILFLCKFLSFQSGKQIARFLHHSVHFAHSFT